MSISPIITFKAGQCDVDTSTKPYKVQPQPDPGFLYLYSGEDELIHFCWRKRDAPLSDPELDLVMVPMDGSFVPYEYKTTPQPSAKTNGRIFVLKFAGSPQRHLFWLQSKPQSQNGDPSYLSPRDRKIGDIVHRLLQGDEVNVARELAAVRNTDDRRDDDDDDDETMEDVEGHRGPHNHRGSTSGGAGPDATGGDVREEGEGSREGGADGARAAASSAPDAASAAVRNFLESLKSQPGLASGQQPGQGMDKPYPHLHQLVPTTITVPIIDTIGAEDPKRLDVLLEHLPPSIIMLASKISDQYDGKNDPTSEVLDAAIASLTLEEKKSLLKKVLRSPQFHQALGVLTQAIRDGGLPSVADALDVKVQNGGYIETGRVPLGGGQAVEAFINGVKQTLLDKRN